jgi:WD40 repeat protein
MGPQPSQSSALQDRHCNKVTSPTTTNILEGHTDEVWNIDWNHDGSRLASASKDKTAIIWRIRVSFFVNILSTALLQNTISLWRCQYETEPSSAARDWTPHLILQPHPYPVSCLAWSMDDSVLLTSSDQFIMLWDTGVIYTLHHAAYST